jgi:hypothetical protein
VLHGRLGRLKFAEHLAPRHHPVGDGQLAKFCVGPNV